MRDLAVLSLHLLVTIARLVGTGGSRAVMAESVPVKHQLPILSRSRKRAPKLRTSDRIIIGLWFAKNLSRRQQQLGTLESVIAEHTLATRRNWISERGNARGGHS